MLHWIPHRWIALAPALASACVAVMLSSAALAVDPYRTQALTPPGAGQAWNGGADACARAGGDSALLTLVDVIDRALCNNPQTRQSWIATRIEAARVGRARTEYLPDLSIQAGANANRTWPFDGTTAKQDSLTGTLTLTHVLFDFGARDANLESARRLLQAANWSHNASLQTVFLSAIQAYYRLFAARANVEAAAEAERAAAESLKAAEVRHQVGTATPADRLQARTAYSQTRLTLTRAEGEVRIAAGGLANAMGLEADTPLDLAPARVEAPDQGFDQSVRELLETARSLRPDLAAADAKLQAARALLRAAQAASRPSVSVSASGGIGNSSALDNFSTGAIGISVNIPLLTGYRNGYDVALAQTQVEAREADRAVLDQRVSLDVWNAWQSLMTERSALINAEDLLDSALQSENVARGRYRAGAGTLIDLLNAQSAASNARFQQAQARYNWHLAKAALASALGTLDIAALAESADTVHVDTHRAPIRK
jgi:outer membrane protein